jgi:ferredoxin
MSAEHGKGSLVKVAVDRRRCISSGYCVMEAPAVFTQDEEGLVVVTDANPPAEQHAAARTAEIACPAAVITVSEDGSDAA